MTKQELLDDLAAKGLRVITVAEQVDSAKNAAGVKSYVANVMEQKKTFVTAKNIGFYVFDEGQAEEAAYYRDKPISADAIYEATKNYLNSKLGVDFIRYEIVYVNEETLDALAKAYIDNGDGTCSNKEVLIYKNQGSAITHKVVS